MKKTIILATLIVFSFLAFAKNITPDWVANYRTLYPDSEYIAQRGRADTEETSKTEAIAQISRYFQTTVNANLQTSIQSYSNGNEVSEKVEVINEVDVMSQVSLFAVECTDPYYNKKEKKWYCLAYINRETAWNQYQPVVEGAKTEFYKLCRNAEKEEDTLTKCTAYVKAWNSGKKFLEKLEYARLLSSKKESAYAGDRHALSEIPGLISEQLDSCSVYLDVKGDYNNLVSSALTEVLSKNGLAVSKNKNGANYIASAIIDDNAQGNDPVSIYPSLDFTITSNKGKAVFASQTAVTTKSVAYSLANAQKKAYPLLAENAKNEINNMLKDKLGL